MGDDIRKRAFALYKPPFRYVHGYVRDACGEAVADDDDYVARVRGWGRIGYLPEPCKLQDAVGELIAEALTAFWTRSQEDDRG